MPRYIDADLLQRELESNGLSNGTTLGSHSGKCELAAYIIAEAPTADVAPVVHGRWVGFETESWKSGKPIMKKYYRCCQCRKASVVRSNFCPNCGAKMYLGCEK